MRPYGTVSPLFWVGKTGKKLRADRDAQVIALYLMTSPHSHQTGVYHLPLLYLSTEVGVSVEEALKALRRLEADGFCCYDESTEWIWVCEMAAWQIGESLKDTDKRAIGVRQYLDSLPRLPFEGAYLARYHADYHLDATPQKRGSTHPSKGLTLIRSDQSRIRTEQEQSRAAAHASATKLLPPAGESNGGSSPKAHRGSRIPEDFSLTPELRQYAIDRGVDPTREFEGFTDYWRSSAGAKALKADWPATWRTWVRRCEASNPRAKGGADNGLPFAN